MIENIALFESANGNANVLLLTDQASSALPDRIVNSPHFKDVITLAGHSIKDKLKAIRGAMADKHRVYNVQHPNDILPSIALDTSFRPQTIYINHADHVFWTGAHFCDCILNIRPFAKSLTETRRNSAVTSIVLPVKLNLSKPHISKADAKRQLNLPPDQKVFLTISRIDKVYPDQNYNFFKTLRKVSKLHHSVLTFFIGVDTSQYQRIMSELPPANLRLLGLIEDPLLYQCAADVYLEGMPVNSLTALVESIYAGAYPILMWGPHHPNVNMERELFINSTVTHPRNEEFYFKEIEKALNPDQQSDRNDKINQMRSYIERYNSNEYWQAVLASIDLKKQGAESVEAEYCITDTDLSIAEQWESHWAFQQSSPYFETLRLGAAALTLAEICKLWYQFVYNDESFRFSKRITFLFRILYRKIEIPHD